MMLVNERIPRISPPVKGFKLNKFASALAQIASRAVPEETYPGHHHRPCLDAAKPIDALLEIKPESTSSKCSDGLIDQAPNPQSRDR